MREGKKPTIGCRTAVFAIAATFVFVVGATAARSDSERGVAAAAADPPANSVLPAITGTAQQGQTLAASSGSWSGSTPITYAYRWRRCDSGGASCADISGATGETYVIGSADVTKTIRVEVTATNSAGSAEATSSATPVVSVATAPANTSIPSIAGSALPGQTLTADKGSWTGTEPISYKYQWLRCDSDGNCSNISGETGQSYILTSSDVGKSVRVTVTASNAGGSAQATSSSIGISGATAPVNTSKPRIDGDEPNPVQGKAMTAKNGSWSGSTPLTYSYQWVRCDGAGKNCQNIGGATKQSYTPGADDVGRTLFVHVTAKNSFGSGTADSGLTKAVQALSQPSPAGEIRLSDGRISVPASSVVLPNRLVISGVGFSPSILRSRTPFTARFRITDTSGHVVRDALVYIIGLPYGRIARAPKVRTGTDGWATVELRPTAKLPLVRGGALVFFVRAHKDGGSLLAGVSTRRLVQVRLGTPG